MHKIHAGREIREHFVCGVDSIRVRYSYPGVNVYMQHVIIMQALNLLNKSLASNLTIIILQNTLKIILA